MNINDICDYKPKKRGRPKKSYTNMININYINKIKIKNPVTQDKNEELILHLPIKINDIPKQQNTIYSMCSNDNENKNNIINENDNDNENKNIFTLNVDTVKDKNLVTFTEMSESENDNINNNINNNINTQEIERLRKENYELKRHINFSNKKEIKLYPININIINNDDKDINNDNKNITCWWCTYDFNTTICSIPTKYYDNKYFVFGIFCSYNCAAAYNLHLCDYKLWDRHSLLNKLYKQLYDVNTNITIAPPKELLQKYGGILAIEEYRNNFNINTKDYRLILPLCNYVTSLVEETTRVNIDNLNNDNLVIKRNKPLPHQNFNILDSLTNKK